MNKNSSDKEIIDFMIKETGCINGFVTRDDEGIPTTYESKEDNGFVFALICNEDNDFMDYYKLQ